MTFAGHHGSAAWARAAVFIVMVGLFVALVSRVDVGSTTVLAPGTPNATASAASPYARIAPGISDQLAVLRRPLNDGDAIPTGVQVTDGYIDWAHARRIAPVAPDGAPGADRTSSALWLSPATGGTVCLQPKPPEADGPALACADAGQVAAGQLVMTQTWDRSNVVLYGVVPDGVTSVRVTFEDGSARSLPVDENVYSARFDKPTRTVAFTDADGGRHVVNAGTEY